MTLAEAKSKALKLLDEKTDKDYKDKLNPFFDMGQQKFASLVKPFIKTATVASVDGKINLPDDLHLIKRILLNKKPVTWQYIGSDVYVDTDGDYLIEYNAYPSKIDINTVDTYEFEIAKDIQQALPYFVAAQCVIKESDQRPYISYTDEMNSILAAVSQRTPQITITGGVL